MTSRATPSTVYRAHSSLTSSSSSSSSKQLTYYPGIPETPKYSLAENKRLFATTTAKSHSFHTLHIHDKVNMARGGTTQSKIHFKGKSDDFLVFVDDIEAYKRWLNDKSVPLVEVVSAFQVFVTHK